MSKYQKDITKKPGYKPYRKDRKWQSDLVAVRVPDMPQDGEPEVAGVGINGTHYNVPRGKDVKVPRLVAENLKTRFQHHWAINPRGGSMKYLGQQSRFYVIELTGDKAAAAVEIKPAAPIAADQRVAFAQAALLARQEDAVAAREAASSPHEDLV